MNSFYTLNKSMDENIELALKNKDITNIMHKACSTFLRSLPEDEIHSCQLYALWRSFVNFKPSKGSNFLTYLYHGVYIECIKAVKFKDKSKPCNRQLHSNMGKTYDSTLLMEIIDELKTDEEKDLIIDKFYNLTIEEMASKRNYSRETVRKKLKKVYSQLQDKFE